MIHYWLLAGNLHWYYLRTLPPVQIPPAINKDFAPIADNHCHHWNFRPQ